MINLSLQHIHHMLFSMWHAEVLMNPEYIWNTVSLLVFVLFFLLHCQNFMLHPWAQILVKSYYIKTNQISWVLKQHFKEIRVGMCITLWIILTDKPCKTYVLSTLYIRYISIMIKSSDGIPLYRSTLSAMDCMHHFVFVASILPIIS